MFFVVGYCASFIIVSYQISGSWLVSRVSQSRDFRIQAQWAHVITRMFLRTLNLHNLKTVTPFQMISLISTAII